MKLKLALATAGAVLALPMSPAVAAEAIPGTCYETEVQGGPSATTRTYQCECLVGVPWVTITPTRTVLITYCHANLST